MRPSFHPLLRLAPAFLVLLAAPVHAEDAAIPDRSNVFGTGPSYRSWDLDSDLGTETISQFHVPFSATIPVGPALDFVAYGAYARTKLEFENGDEATLSGLTDVRLKGVYRPMPRVQVSAGVNLPVGKQTLLQGQQEALRGQLAPLHDGNVRADDREIEVAQAMWSPILGFRTKRMGEGFDVELGAGCATPLSPSATLGLSLAYVLRGKYDLFETPDAVTTFKPGGEGSATVGVDFRPAEGTLFRLDVTGRTYSDDESNDVKVYKAGTQFEIDASFVRATDAWSLALRGRNVSRSDDEQIAESGSDVVRTTVSAPHSLWGLGEAYYQLGSGLALGAQVEAASFGQAETVLSDGRTIGVGPGLRVGSAGSRRVTLRALYLTGDAENGSIDLSGFDVSVAAAFPF